MPAAYDLKPAQKRLKWYTETAEPSSIVLRGAALMEDALEELLTRRLIQAEKWMHVKSMSLERKTKLAASIGAIDELVFNLLGEYRKFRNQVAHRVGFEVTRDDEEALLRRFEAHGFFNLDRHYDALAFPRTLIMLGAFIYVKLVLLSGGIDQLEPPHVEAEQWREHIFPVMMVFQALYQDGSAAERAETHLNARGIKWAGTPGYLAKLLREEKQGLGELDS